MIFDAHQNRHHHADGPCYSGAVVTDLCEGLVVPAFGIPLKSLEQGVE